MRKNSNGADSSRTERSERGSAIAVTALRILPLMLAAAVLFIMYGPWKKLSDLYITTAMHTSDHKWLATAIYPDGYIEKVMERNAVVEPAGAPAVVTSSATDAEPELVELSGSGWSGYMLIVPSAKNIRFVFAGRDGGMLLEGLASSYRAKAAVNASGYATNGSKGACWGFTVSSGIVKSEIAEDGFHSFAALDFDNELHIGRMTAEELTAQGYRDVIEFGPLLMLDGERADISGNGGGVAPRTAIGQTADGKVLLLVTGGRDLSGLGASLCEVQDIMEEFGAVSALNLDGGYSSCMYYDGRVICQPIGSIENRMLPNAIIVY